MQYDLDPTADATNPVAFTAQGRRNVQGSRFNMWDIWMRILGCLQVLVRSEAIAGATFTRPADTTAYAIGDLVANSTTPGSVVPMQFTVARWPGGGGIIRRLRLAISGTVVTNAQFRLHLYKDKPTVTNGDNGVWLSTTGTWIGSLDVTVDKVFSDGAKGVGIPTTGTEINFDVNASSKVLYGLLEARAAFTPTSAEIFTPVLEIQDF